MLQFFRTIVRWRRFILVSGLVAALIMVAVSLLLPKWYTASTSLFPPENSPTMPMYSQLLQNISMPLLGPMAAGAAPETIYIDMLKSRAICDQIIDEFDLAKVYETELIEYTREAFLSHCGYSLLENGLLVVTYEDKDPERAANVANRMVVLLDELTRDLKITRAARTRGFVAGQLDEREQELQAAEQALREFQEKNQALELTQQLTSAMEIVTELTGQAIALETQLEILGEYATKSSDEYVRKQREYKEVLRQLSKLKERSGDSDGDMVRSFIPNLGEVPELALELVRLRREVEIQSTVYKMLVQEYEKARIEEARDTPTVQILDAATVPNLRSRPKRKVLVIAGAVVGIGWGVVIALLLTAWRENREQSAVLRDVVAPVVSDFSRVFRRR